MRARNDRKVGTVPAATTGETMMMMMKQNGRLVGTAGMQQRKFTNTSPILCAATGLEAVCDRAGGLHAAVRTEVEECTRDVRAVLKDVKLAESGEIEALKKAAEAFSNMLLRTATVNSGKGVGLLPLHVVELWQVSAEVRFHSHPPFCSASLDLATIPWTALCARSSARLFRSDCERLR